MTRRRPATSKLLPFPLLLLVLWTAPLSAAERPRTELAARLDQIFSKTYPAGEPGAAVIVVQNGQTILRKGYGMANLELGVPMAPEMVFRIGSVTKQFTAAAILRLAEQGKLSLQDDLTKSFPDFPTQHKKITIEELLTHTSGIKSYTDMEAWPVRMREDWTPAQMIGFFKDQPADFEPGARFRYNNSAYVLLGAIIEKVSSKKYEDFMQENLFEPLGMENTRYGNDAPIIPGRVSGYVRGPKGFENAPYVSMTQPYSAGGLVSTVDDLARWDASLYTEKLLSAESRRRMWTSFKLSDGTPTRYGYGWGVGLLESHPVMEHGGGIHGFNAAVVRLPEDRVFVAVLSNKAGGEPSARYLAFLAASVVIGKPLDRRKAVSLPSQTLDRYVGVYRIDEKQTLVVKRQGDRLLAQSRPGGREHNLLASSETDFFFKEGLTQVRFVENAKGEVVSALIDSFGPVETATRTAEPATPDTPVATINPAVYDAYVGEYELAPGFVITVTRDGSRLLAQATAQSQFEIFPKSENEFFYKVVDAQITFVKGEAGKVTSLILHQAGRHVPGKKTK